MTRPDLLASACAAALGAAGTRRDVVLSIRPAAPEGDTWTLQARVFDEDASIWRSVTGTCTDPHYREVVAGFHHWGWERPGNEMDVRFIEPFADWNPGTAPLADEAWNTLDLPA